MNQFSSLFEILATLNLAYVGIESIREGIINTLTDFYTPDDLEITKKRINDEFKTVVDGLEGGTFGIGLQSYTENIKRRFDKAQDDLEEEHNLFMKKTGFKPMFFAGFLFCFSNLLLIGYEEFFTTYSSLTAEQWFLGYFIYILILFFEYPKKWFKHLRKHNALFLTFFIFLGLAFGYSLCPNVFPEIPHVEKIVMSFSLIVAVIPFVLEYFQVKKHAKARAGKLKDITNETSMKLKEISDTITGDFPIS